MKNNKESSLTYKKALSELEELVKKIENPETELEDISGEVKKALELIKYCRETIKGYKEETSKLME